MKSVLENPVLIVISFLPLSPQRQHPDGQRRHAGLPGGPGGPPRGAQVSSPGGGRVAVRAGPRRHGTDPRGLPDGLSGLPQVDGKLAHCCN